MEILKNKTRFQEYESRSRLINCVLCDVEFVIQSVEVGTRSCDVIGVNREGMLRLFIESYWFSMLRTIPLVSSMI